MNQIINTILLTGDRFMPEMHLGQPGLTYSACGPFAKNLILIKLVFNMIWLMVNIKL